MKLHILSDAKAVSAAAARHIADRVQAGGVKVIGLATGRSPIAIYELLSAEVAAGRLSFADVTSFNLDEYLGLSAENSASFHAFMQRHFFSKVPLLAHHIPDGMAQNPLAEAEAYEAKILAAGGIDLQLLGIGSNGHIGFNEPGSAHDSRTRIVTLAESTRIANATDFAAAEDVPHYALTMGIATIMSAREEVLIATGPAKAQALRAAIKGPISPDCPASVLQSHPNLHIFADECAASLL